MGACSSNFGAESFLKPHLIFYALSNFKTNHLVSPIGVSLNNSRSRRLHIMYNMADGCVVKHRISYKCKQNSDQKSSWIIINYHGCVVERGLSCEENIFIGFVVIVLVNVITSIIWTGFIGKNGFGFNCYALSDLWSP